MDEPALETVMRGAGFDLQKVDGHAEPGRRVAPANVAGRYVLIPVDLIVPEAAAFDGGKRGVRLSAHGKRAARRAVGLEAVLLDHCPMDVAALDTTDTRSVEVEVAGPVTVEAIGYIEELFGRRGRPGIAMAAQALRIGVSEAQVQTLAVSYTERLLGAALS